MAKDTRIEQTMTAVGGLMMLAAAASTCVVDGGLTLAAYGGALLNKLLDTASGFGLSKGMDRATEVLGGGNDPASVLENEHLEKVIAEALALRMEIVAKSLTDDQQREAVEQIAKEVRRDTKFLGPDVLFELFSTRPNDFGRERVVSKASFQGQLGEVIRRVRSSRGGLKHSLHTETQQRIVDGWITYFAKDVLSVVTQDDTLGQRAFAKLTLLLLGTILAETKQATSADEVEAHQKALEATESALRKLDADVRKDLGDVIDWLTGIDKRLGRIEGKVDAVKRDTEAIIGLLSSAPLTEPGSPAAWKAPQGTPFFLGRSAQVARVLDLLDAHRVLNLTGTGGIGKTEVALAIAAQAAEHGQTVWYADLSSAERADAVADLLVREWDLKAAPSPARLATQLESDRLYVLDDVHQALVGDEQATRALLRTLTQQAPTARFLVTSRNGCIGRAERVRKLTDDAPERLFDRIAADVGYAWQSGDEVPKAALLDALDGMPLAITLAARLLADFSLAQVWHRWQRRRTDALNRLDTTDPTRLDSLTVSLDLSYDTLPDEGLARDVFALFAYLPAGAFTNLLTPVLAPVPEDAEEGAQEQARDAVEDALLLLYKRALLQRTDTRYTMLVPVSTYALDKRTSEDAVPRLDAMLLALAQQADAQLVEETAAVNRLLTAELPNLHAALDRAAKQGDDAYLVRLSGALRRFYTYAPPSEETQRRLGAARNAAQRRGDPQSEANAVSALGYVHKRLGEYAQARGRYEEALPIFREIGARLGEANTVRALGDVHRMLDEYEQARRRYEEALPIFREIGARLGEANTVRALGDVHMALGEYAQARGRYEEALPIFRDTGARLGEANTVQALGDVHRMLDEYEQARRRYEEALPILRDTGARLGEANTVQSLGLLAQSAQRYDEAGTLLGDALVLYQAIGARLGEAHTRWYLGLLLEEEERWAEAIAELERSIEVYGTIGLENDVALSQQRIAAIKARM